MARPAKPQARSLGSRDLAPRENHLIVAVSGSDRSEALVRSGRLLADAIGASWEAIHVETPDADRESPRGKCAAEALALAAKLGATIATLPAASALVGIQAHLDSAPAQHLVLGGAGRRPGFWRQSFVEVLAARNDDLVLHVHADASPAHGTSTRPGQSRPATPLRSYAYAAALVAATLLASEVLQLFLGTRPLDLLFLFPVIAVAARFGLPPALLAVALSVVCYNYFLLLPAYSFNAAAPQNLVMTGVLIAVAVYTGVITTRMRGRLVLSDRSARENASVAALAQKLTRDADWSTTAVTICEHVNHLLKVQAIVYREVDGTLIVAGSAPAGVALGPVDQAALEWAWNQGEEAGSGTATMAAADWQFQPLKTSLGTLAVLGLASEDGRNPVRADQRMLFQTLLAQSALAHERLRLEDVMQGKTPPSIRG
jgi:K+-sensing histidine kinase KdpD